MRGRRSPSGVSLRRVRWTAPVAVLAGLVLTGTADAATTYCVGFERAGCAARATVAQAFTDAVDECLSLGVGIQSAELLHHLRRGLNAERYFLFRGNAGDTLVFLGDGIALAPREIGEQRDRRYGESHQ